MIGFLILDFGFATFNTVSACLELNFQSRQSNGYAHHFITFTHPTSQCEISYVRTIQLDSRNEFEIFAIQCIQFQIMIDSGCGDQHIGYR